MENYVEENLGKHKIDIGKAYDLTGKKFGRLTVIRADHRYKPPLGAGGLRWECLCDCGKLYVALSYQLTSGRCSSCGCYSSELAVARSWIHGHRVDKVNSPTYNSWLAMIRRCTRPDDKAYPQYGAEGVTVCERWFKFENFLADMGERPSGTTIHRVRGAKIYSKETCEWASLTMQAYDQKIHSNNTSGRTGVTFDVKAGKWRSRISYEGKRINLGYFESFEDAVFARSAAELEYYGFNKE